MIGPPPFPGTPAPLGAAANDVRTLHTNVEMGPDQGVRVRLDRLTLLSSAELDGAFLAIRVLEIDLNTRPGKALIDGFRRHTRGYYFHLTFLSVTPLCEPHGPHRKLCAPPSPTIRRFGERSGQQPCLLSMRHRSHEESVNGAGSRAGALPQARSGRRRQCRPPQPPTRRRYRHAARHRRRPERPRDTDSAGRVLAPEQRQKCDWASRLALDYLRPRSNVGSWGRSGRAGEVAGESASSRGC